tara:strand:+ start:246 stop:458 length:213 start_codon:yes stop_codon:yes gene_type:complete
MNLVIETQDTFRAGDLENAFNDAINATTKTGFIERLQDNMPNTIIGVGGNHIWVAELNKTRIGIIINPFN